MLLNILQLNTYGGLHLEKIIEFIEKNNFDILQLQEVAHGKWLKHESVHNFTQLENYFTKKYNGELAVATRLKNNPDSYFGNATFYRKEFKLLNKKITWMNRYKILEKLEGRIIQKDPRNILTLTLEIEGKKVDFVNTHGFWGPNPKDRAYKLRHINRMYKHLESLKNTFIVTGDFNMTPDTQAIQLFDKITINQTKKHNITNTLDSDVHKVKALFPPGLAVDYIFTDTSLNVIDFKVHAEKHLSDHLALSAKVEI